LATGFPIQETVQQLIALQARRRDLLVDQNKKIDTQRTAVTALTAQLVAVQIQVKRLGTASIYSQRTVSTTNTDVLEAAGTGAPVLGEFPFTPLRMARAQQLQSSRFASRTDPIGAGTFSFRFGGFVDKGVDLDLLNGGEGFAPGSIQITDRSGKTAEIDLSLARTIDDVLEAINGNKVLGVRATIHNDRIRLIDETGATTANLSVDELEGTTAASLGLSGIDVAANVAEGQDILTLFDDIALSELNTGSGVRFDGFLGDLRVTLGDGSRINLDFNKLAFNGTFAHAATDSANGVNASLSFTAREAGPDFGDIAISFVDDPTVVAGQEFVDFDAEAKTLVFRIDAGTTTANQIIEAAKRDEEVAAKFSVTNKGDGTGVVSVADTAITQGPKATATTPGGDHAKLLFTAKNVGAEYDNVAIRFVDDPAVTAGNETVSYDDSNPLNRELVFRIEEGATTANDIISALNNNSQVSQVFGAANVQDNNGTGLVKVTDTAYTSGGALAAATDKVNDITLGQVLEAINAAAPGKLQASVGVNNNLVLTDLTGAGTHTFKVEQLNGSHAAEDLGIAGEAENGVITGLRLLGGLKTSLLSTLNGDKGFGELGLLSITDRGGETASIDLSTAQTLDDVLEAINTAGIGVAARVNDARNGILLSDTTVGTGNLVIVNGDETQTATKLGLEVDGAQDTKSTGSLRLQVVSESTLLQTLNGGAGVSAGTVRILDNAGGSGLLTIDGNTKTIGDVIRAINNLGLKVEARINDEGDGILLVDKAVGGGTTFGVEEGSGRTARDLHLLGGTKTIEIDGEQKQVVDGSTTVRIELTATDTLEDLVQKINDTGANVRATLFSDGSSVKPFRFTIFNQSPGQGNELLWDTSGVDFTLEESVKGQDALLQVGPPGAGGVLASSNTNSFQGLLPDVTLTVKGVSLTAVTVSVASSDSSLITAIKDFVESYNAVREKIAELTHFDTVTGQAAVLQGDGRLLRVESDLNELVSGRLFGAGTFQSLETLGIEVKPEGRLEFDEEKLKQKYAESPNEVKDFFSKKDTGLSSRFDKLIEQLAGIGDTVLVGRAAVLTRKFEQNQERINVWNIRLERRREQLIKSFQQSETIIAKLQSSLAALNSIAPLPVLVPQQQ
jgi:flagellar hook-associated protein 2